MKKIFGIGINDTNQYTKKNDIYNCWVNMLNRCYYDKSRPTYKDCSVCDEWLFYSNFHKWAKPRFVKGYHLDKDLNGKGEKIYSPETCMFVPFIVNQFIVATVKNNLPQGVHYINADGHKKRYSSKISNPITKRREYLGVFETELEAHEAWLKRKREIAKDLCGIIDCKEVKVALLSYYN